MALIMYLSKAPRYKDVTAADIELMESYFSWRHENKIGGSHSGGTFERWCGHSENELPNETVIKYYRSFWNKKTYHIEGVGKTECYGILEQLARIVKANQIFNWFLYNVMDGLPTNEYYEVSRQQIKELLTACCQVRSGFIPQGVSIHGETRYAVNTEIAQKYLPTIGRPGFFWGPTVYEDIYARQVVNAIRVLYTILISTDFEKETLYFNALS